MTAPYMVLCRPLATCAKRNECYRYRVTPEPIHKFRDFTDRSDGADRCLGYLPLYDSDDDLSPPDLQESRGPD